LLIFTRGLVYTKLRDFPAALKSFDRAIQLDGSKVEYVVNRATVRFYQKDWEGAEAELQIAMQLDPREPNIYNTLSLLEIEKNNLAKRRIGWEGAQAFSRPPLLPEQPRLYLPPSK